MRLSLIFIAMMETITVTDKCKGHDLVTSSPLRLHNSQILYDLLNILVIHNVIILVVELRFYHCVDPSRVIWLDFPDRFNDFHGVQYHILYTSSFILFHFFFVPYHLCQYSSFLFSHSSAPKQTISRSMVISRVSEVSYVDKTLHHHATYWTSAPVP